MLNVLGLHILGGDGCIVGSYVGSIDGLSVGSVGPVGGNAQQMT